MNWPGRPLTSYQLVVNLIGSTTTSAGLNVGAELHRINYLTGTRITATTSPP